MKRSIVIFSVLLLLLTGCNKNEKKEPEKLDYTKEITISVGEEVPDAQKFFSDTTSLSTKDIKWNNMEVEENKVYYTGAYTGTIKDNNDYE